MPFSDSLLSAGGKCFFFVNNNRCKKTPIFEPSVNYSGFCGEARKGRMGIAVYCFKVFERNVWRPSTDLLEWFEISVPVTV